MTQNPTGADFALALLECLTDAEFCALYKQKLGRDLIRDARVEYQCNKGGSV
jgi:hypothetical protein